MSCGPFPACATSAPTSGKRSLMDEVVGIYFGENWISVDPNVDYDETVAKIQEVVDGYPGLYRDVQTYLKERIREVLTGSGEAIVVRIYGPELEVLRSKADEVRDAMAEIDGIVDLHVELQQDIPQVEVEVDLEAAKYYGIKPGDVRRAAATLISGVEVGDIYEHHGRTYEVYVWSTPETRNSVSDIRELLIDTPAGGHVRLEDVADVRIAPVPNVIAREDMSRRINVEANVRGRDLGSVAQDVARALETIEFPLGVSPGADRRIRGAAGGPTAASDRFGGRRARDLLPPADVLRQLALGDVRLPDPAIGAGGWGARGVSQYRRDLTRGAGRLSHGVRHCGAQQHSSDRPLSASRAL